MAKWPWRSRSMTSIFNNSRENPKMHIWCKIGDSSSNPLQVITQTSQISKNSKSKWPIWLERQGQWPPFSIPAESILWCMFWCKFGDSSPNLDELSRGQAKFPKILSQNGQNDLEGQGQWPLFSIPSESIPRCMFGANLVILAQINDELSCGQTETQMHVWCKFGDSSSNLWRVIVRTR